MREILAVSGLIVLVAVLFGWWGRKVRRPLIEPSDRMSDAWMKEHIYQTGQQGEP